MNASPVVRSRAAAVLAGAGALSLLLGAVALVASPGAAATELSVGVQAGPVDTLTDRSGSRGGDPRGNNGTVKIEDTELDKIPNNTPHPGCVFTVEFYNFDKGDYNATVSFKDQAPTKDGGLKVESGDLTPFIGEDAADGGKDLDAQETYKLSFTGEPHPKQGFHVKLTVKAPGSIGNDRKHKVFWVEDCETTPPTTTPTTPPVSETPPTTPPVSETPPTTPPASETPPTTPPVSETPPTTPPVSETPPTTPPASETPSTTPPTIAPSTTPTDTVAPTDTTSPTGGVPTAVDAGLGGGLGGGSFEGAASGRSSLGLLGGGLVAAGGLLLAVGASLALKRRSRHSF